MRVHLLAFGKLKTGGLRETADYYKKILRPWATLEEIELKPVPVPDKGHATRALIQEKEAALLFDRMARLKKEPPRFWLLDECGLAVPTQTWAKMIRTWENESVSEVAFCIGSSLGFSDAVKEKAQGILSFGPQTFSHELARVVLLEQLYRGWSVVRGHPYHVQS